MQLRFICPHCNRVEQVTVSEEINWPCAHANCACGLRNRYVNVVLDAVRCLSCRMTEECVSPKVLPIKGTFKKQKKKK